MSLDLFLIDLMQTGQVTVPREPTVFDEATLAQSMVLLAAYHEADCQEMPGIAPVFDADAALWAAKFIFSTIQFILVRELDESQIEQSLKDYEAELTPEVIYSADLMLRFLPDLFKFASGLSPDDPLITKLRIIASKWMFSSVGIKDLTIGDSSIILQHPSLSTAYIDRIIQKKDLQRLDLSAENGKLKEVLGMYQQELWPLLSEKM